MATAPFPKTALRLIGALACIAVATSGYLLYQKLSGSYDDCCGHILNTRWSQWFGIPVSAFAFPLYLTLFVVSLPAFAAARPAATGLVLRAGAMLAAGAGIWFFGILWFVERASCPYCIATHLCGLTIAATVFTVRRSLPSAGGLPFGVAGAGLLVLAAGQLLSKSGASFEIAGADGGNGAAATEPGDKQEIVFNDRVSLRLGQFPSVGPAEPKHYIADIFDYTCKSCRQMYEDIKALEQKYPDTFAVIYVPAPLNRRCNLFLPTAVRDHQHACELAQAALAVWSAEPSKFAEFHHYLMTSPLPIPPADAEAKAISLVGEQPFRAAHDSAANSTTLRIGLGHYGTAASGNIKMPKLLVPGGGILHGLAPSTDAFLSLMAKQFGLQ